MQTTTRAKWIFLLLFAAGLFGGVLRFMPAIVTRFPLNDGGMFYDMTRELRANEYHLPAVTGYNGLDLPYAYPPLGFYLTSLLADLGRIPLLNLFLWLPPLLATLAIPAFYLLARALLADDLRAALATLFFALTPGSYAWHLMGGGITRALGMLFLLLAAFFVYRLFREGNVKLIFPAILVSSLAVLSHPEVGLQAAGLCFVFWLFLGRTWRGLFRAFLVSLGVALLTAPWWGTVIAQHGLSPFLSALQTGQHASVQWTELLAAIFLPAEFIPLLFILRVLGLGYAIWKRQYLLLALAFAPALLDPRSTASISLLSMSMLSALGFLDAVPALIQKLRGVEIGPTLNTSTGVISFFILASLLFVQCGFRNYTLINTTLVPGEREAMTWIRESLSPHQDFILITGRTYSMSDPAQAWFPALTGHHSQTTLQGLEWTLGPQFTGRLNDLASLQSCADLACVQAWSERTRLACDYLWVAKPLSALVDDVRASAKYRVVYESEFVVIFAGK